MLKEDDIRELERRLDAALEIELPRLAAVRENCKGDLQFETLGGPTGELYPIATVATDGGENQLRLDPIRIHVLRVADSDGNIHFDGFIPISLEPDQILEQYFLDAPLMRMLESELGIAIRDFQPANSYQRGSFLQMLRELLEWGAILKLAMERRSPPRLIMRDGLLRSVMVPEALWGPLHQRLEHYSRQHRHLLVGVAKRSEVLNYLSLAVSLEAVLPQGSRGYARIPRSLEAEAAPPAYRWLGPRSMGQLVAVRPTEHSGMMYACEIPDWQQSQTSLILAHLAANAGAFPQAGYPLALSRAHQHARIGDFEIAFVEKLLLQNLRLRDPALSQEVALQQLLGRRLSLPPEDSRA